MKTETLLLTLIRVDDPVRYARYSSLASEAAAIHGARFLARGTPIECLEGSMGVNRAVASVFQSPEAARAYYHSAEYQRARQERIGAAGFEMVMIGMAAPQP